MAYILNIDTATNVCSVALSKDGELVDLIETSTGMSHSTKLSLFIEQILEKQSLKVLDLAAVAVSLGPGSYTGLRIGVSTAKGICFGADLPLISVSTLQALAYGAKKDAAIADGVICPMIDARRMEVYSAIYDIENKLVEKDSAVVIEDNSYDKYLTNNKVYFCGNGSNKCKDTLTNKNAIFIDNIETSAKNMISISFEKFMNNKFEDLAYFEPFYLKTFIAGKPKKLL